MAKKLLSVMGIVFLLVGILGLFSDKVLGIFEVDMVHNVVHLVSGALTLIFAGRGEKVVKGFALTFAAVYGLVTILGFVSDSDHLLGVIHINDADNYLHLLLTLLFLGIGLIPSREE